LTEKNVCSSIHYKFDKIDTQFNNFDNSLSVGNTGSAFGRIREFLKKEGPQMFKNTHFTVVQCLISMMMCARGSSPGAVGV
jgi:hypothetical protein